MLLDHFNYGMLLHHLPFFIMLKAMWVEIIIAGFEIYFMVVQRLGAPGSE